MYLRILEKICHYFLLDSYTTWHVRVTMLLLPNNWNKAEIKYKYYMKTSKSLIYYTKITKTKTEIKTN